MELMDLPLKMDLLMDMLNTPMKKIQQLTITSPDLRQIMIDKGYSNSISDKVINELNLKINGVTSPKGSHEQGSRYDSIHSNYFDQMESILSHYSIKRNPLELSNTKKKRRTLTGIEESPVHHGPMAGAMQGPGPRLAPTKLSLLNPPTISPPKPSRLSPTRVSPSRVPPRKSISPSKKSYNLNEMLTRKISYPKTRSPTKDTEFKQPKKIEITTERPLLQKKSSIPTLQKKSSIPTLQKKSSIPTLQHKPSIPTLLHKSSIPTLLHKSSIPTLQKKSSIPTLQKKPLALSLSPAAKNRPTTSVSSTSVSSMASYSKPTISSSQKSLDRFSRFKSKFH